ncbi:MAG: hypothetical protein HWE16_13445, partial [Gammaproteobacteria bacterium]|nr:hypothetical protein [Gammaproteobacteria bacterium]
MTIQESAAADISAVSQENLNENQVVVCALYKFVTLENFEQIRQPLLDVMLVNEVKGTLLLANEGINGTVA